MLAHYRVLGTILQKSDEAVLIIFHYVNIFLCPLLAITS